jgi:hypothetical protein
MLRFDLSNINLSSVSSYISRFSRISRFRPGALRFMGFAAHIQLLTILKP